METHRYVRPQLTTSKNSIDPYNGLIESSSSSSFSSLPSSFPPNDTPTEYWTNGTITHIGVTPRSTSSSTTMTQVEPHLMSTTTTTTNSPQQQKPHYHHHHRSHMIRDSLLAGSIAGMVSTATIYPMDVLRTKLQNGGAMASTAAASSANAVRIHPQQQLCSNTTTSTTAFRGSGGSGGSGGPVVTVLRETIAQGGFRALYTGMTLPLLAQAVYKGTVFSVQKWTATLLQEQRFWEAQKTGQVYPSSRSQQQQQSQELPLLCDVWISGAVAGAVNALLFVTPVELVRNQWIAGHHHHLQPQPQQSWNTTAATMTSRTMAPSNNNRSSVFRTTSSTATTSTGTGSSTWHFIRRTVQQHGVRSLWRGASWAVARDGIGCGFFFWTMAYTTRQVQAYNSERHFHHHQQHQYSNSEPLSFASTLACGALSGLAFWVSSLPLDTIKTWIQSADLNQTTSSTSSNSNTGTHSNMLVRQRLEQLYYGTSAIGGGRGGGRAVVHALFRGWQVAYGRGMPAAAITMAVYLYTFDWLQRMEEY